MMEGDLINIVNSEDCEKGIKLLTDTLKKQHVNNFAMQQEVLTAMNKKTEIENWKQALVSAARRSQESLVEQNMANIAEMKAVQRSFSEFAVMLPTSSSKAAKNAALNSSSGQANNTKLVIMDLQQRIEGVWIKSERVNNDMIRMFSQLIK